MQPFWCWLVTKVPLWLAPNLITFIGLVINIITTFPVLLLDRNAQGLVSEIVNCFVFSPHLGGGGGDGQSFLFPPLIWNPWNCGGAVASGDRQELVILLPPEHHLHVCICESTFLPPPFHPPPSSLSPPTNNRRYDANFDIILKILGWGVGEGKSQVPPPPLLRTIAEHTLLSPTPPPHTQHCCSASVILAWLIIPK